MLAILYFYNRHISRYDINNMKKNYKRLIPLLFALPALMANAPMPQVFNDTYKDYQLTYVSHAQNGEKYDYTYHLKNTGKGYIDYVHLEYEANGEYYILSYYPEYDNVRIFRDAVLEPGFDKDIVMSRSSEIPNIKKLKTEVKGYAQFDNSVTIGGTKAITLGNHYSNTYYYKIDLDFEYSDTNWNYGAILKLEYEENIYYIKVDERGGYQIETVKELDLTKLSVLDITVIKSRPSYYGIVDAFAIITIVFFVCLFVLVGGGIFAAIFIPIMVRKKRNRRAAALAKKQNK